MKTFFLLFLFAGAGWAASTDTFHFSSTEGFNPIAEYKPEVQVLNVQIPIPCDHQWRKTNYVVFSVEDAGKFMTPNIEVCAKCGLLRITPKDLKK